MSSYSYLERSLARVLSKSPFFKKLIKNIYSYVTFLVNKKKYIHNTMNHISAVEVNESSTFFGYYDKSPTNSVGDILVFSTDRDTSTHPTPDSVINLEVRNSLNECLLKISTHSYNWQQGARAHWLNDDLFIVNDYDSDRYISRVFTVKEKKEAKTFNYPVQDSYKTSYFLSINYQRLMCLRPDYGYRNMALLTKADLNNLEDDGIWKVDFETGESRLLVSLAQTCSLHFKKEFSFAVHKLNHVMISPSGEKFIFMHRYLLGKRRFDRLVLANSKTGELKLIADYGMVSHCCWLDDDNIIGYLRGPGRKDGYWKISLSREEITPFYQNVLSSFGDGHPHVHGDFVVTDTYPDKARMQSLLMINWKTGELSKLGEFFHPFKFYGESRCDLHPRFSEDGKSVFFDSVFTGKRQLYKMSVF